jgi:putative aldouronate transport system substrate-binding protein
MKVTRYTACFVSTVMAVGTLAGCAGGKDTQSADKPDVNTPLEITIATPQVGEAPSADSEIQRAMEKYTNAKVSIQWIPSANFEEKKNTMFAANELPKAFNLKMNPSTVSAAESDQFWDIGPYLKDYKYLSAADPMHYENIKIGGKIYGIPNFRDIGRAGVIYRKDWFDALGLKVPVTLDDWYNVIKILVEQDPDKNGKNDTYGIYMDKTYNEPTASSAFLTKLAVSQGAPNKWGVEDGKVIAEFMTKPYEDSLKLLRRLYAEKLINQDFSVVQSSDTDNKWNTGATGIRTNNNASGAATSYDNVVKSVPTAKVDVAQYVGPSGNRVPAEPGNNGFYVFPKSTVKTEAELKRLIGFFEKMLEPEMSTLLTRGIEGRHYKKTEDGKAEVLDLSLVNREMKPYRDSIPSFEVTGSGLPLKQSEHQAKGWKVTADNLKNAVPNVALTLTSKTYSDRGTELDTLIKDAQTKYVMGKIDDAGWQTELANWKKTGGDKVMAEFTADYTKLKK